MKLSTCADLKVYEWKMRRGFESKPDALNDLIENIDLVAMFKALDRGGRSGLEKEVERERIREGLTWAKQ